MTDRSSYLSVLFPLLLCGVSLLHLAYVGGYLFVRSVRLDGFASLSDNVKAWTGTGFVDTLGYGPKSTLPSSSPSSLHTHADDDDDGITTELSRPRAPFAVQAIEAICLLGELGITLGILIASSSNASERRAEVAAAVVWLYLIALGLLRVYISLIKLTPLSFLWDHAAALYCSLWILMVVNFRSALTHPHLDHRLQSLAIVRFCLMTVLVLLATLVRRGNRAVLLLHEGKAPPSREPLAGILSIGTFSWFDSFIWYSYNRPLVLDDVWNVLPTERTAAVLASYRLHRQVTRLSLHLIKFFKWDLLFQQFWTVIANVSLFLPTLLLQAILQYIEDPSATPAATAWLYVVLLPLVSCILGVADGQGLWRGRKICIKLRSVLIGEVFAKTLRRKAASSGDTDMNASDTKPSNSATGILALLRKLLGAGSKDSETRDGAGSNAELSNSNEQAKTTQVNSGTILNLMSVDTFKVSEISAYFHFLIPSVPVQTFMAVTLLYRVLGWSAIAGVVIMVSLLPLNMFFAGQFSKTHKAIMAATDRRIHATNEVMQNVRIIKFFAWEDRFAKNVEEKRRAELAAIRYRFIIWSLASITWFSVPLIIATVTFFLYTVVEQKPLVPSVAFTALSLFSLLRQPLDRLADMLAHTFESQVSIGRVETFLNEEETTKYDQLKPVEDDTHVGFIGFKSATFSWGPMDEPSNSALPAFRLINLDVEFHLGGLNIIAGPTGSGKTSMLMALLGEMTLVAGRVYLPGGYNRALLKPDTDGLTESVAYCAQQAWLVNDNIKRNITFASPYNEERYKQVIAACALERDFEVFESGDLTLVGEKGVVVSGGQKQRISLARALYSNAKYILLDDCLSAVDSHTAQHIFDHCIVGPLMAKRTCILVTHNIALCLPRADHVVVLRNGKIAEQGSADTVMGSGALGAIATKSRKNSNDDFGADASTKTESNLNGTMNGQTANGSAENNQSHLKQSSVQEQEYVEKTAVGSVSLKVISLYLRSMGPWFLWIGILVAYSLENLGTISTNVWIRQWANSYQTSPAQLPSSWSDTWRAYVTPNISQKNLHSTSHQTPASQSASTSTGSVQASTDVGYYLGIYALLSVTYILFALMRLMIIFRGSLHASQILHTGLLNSVLRAKFKFFDVTPLGQIMNRFSKDLQAIDQDIAPIAAAVLQCLFQILVIVVLVSIITPGFLIAGVFLTMVYFAMGNLYLESSRDLKRLESTQRSPLYQQFGEALGGIITIRAYGDEQRFIEDNYSRVDKDNRPFIFLWAANRWLALRVDFAGALVSFFAALFIVLQAGRIDAGAAGLSLTYALQFNESILWLVREYSENEQNMNHVERVKEFLEVEQEAPARIPENVPPGAWPSRGAIRFEKYTTRYRSDLEPVLIDLNFSIRGEEKVGIVGRTGAGKSSLALALFRGLEADAGKIFIDDIDIGKIGLQDLRENLTVVPQDPTLFTGTIRSNLDPFGLFTDKEIFTALRQVHLIAHGESYVDARSLSPILQRIDEHAVHDDRADQGQAAPDMSAPAPIRRASISASSAPAENDQTTVMRINTNSRENANIFLNLSSPVAESGSNLSQGQRQLLCLARALLKAPRVLLMDEATASIDYATDAKIQTTLRELRGSTLITIAHRLQTIVDYDTVLVLDKGKVVEFGPPWELIRKEGGTFRDMCVQTGDLDRLLDLAMTAEKQHQLVDV